MYAWTPRDIDAFDREPGHLREAATKSFRILRLKSAEAVWSQMVADTSEFLGADAIRAFRIDADGIPELTATAGRDAIPVPCLQMELCLMSASLVRSRSLISNHPRLDPAFAALGDRLADRGSVVHTLLVRAYQETHGIVAVHWITSPRPGYERRAGFVHYWDNVGLAVATAEERAALERTAFVDALTGLPNQRALEAEIDRHERTHPLGVLVLDFDGMRAANAAFENDYARGGDVLIVAVASALRAFAEPGETPCRMHTRGDEFCLLLPGSDEETTGVRCERLQRLLTDLQVPETHRHVYRGASVGGAARAQGEPVAETLARASRAMHERKRDRATRSR
jgi:diguanylate cyclase (GGDEF)-like protein